MSDAETEPAMDGRIAENILTELQAQNALCELDLDDDQLRTLARAIAANLDYSFRIEWRA